MLRSGVWSLIHRVTPFSFHADGYKHLGKECGVFGASFKSPAIAVAIAGYSCSTLIKLFGLMYNLAGYSLI